MQNGHVTTAKRKTNWSLPPRIHIPGIYYIYIPGILLFFLLFRGKKCGARSKHAKKAKNAKKARIVEATKNRGRLAEREAGACYDQVILGKG